jgi:3-methyladenine DNA glycosylase AlkD
MTSSDVVLELEKLSDPERAFNSAWFFKTGPGGYGQGDLFLGATVPQTRLVAKKYRELPLKEARKLLANEFHEVRLTALHIMIQQFSRGDEKVRSQIFDVYRSNIQAINNWDLVDTSAPAVVGAYLYEKPRDWLYELVDSTDLWSQRIAIISTFYFIKQGDFGDTLAISEKLLVHEHDLIHKAVGWMLREVGNRDRQVEELFLRQHYQHMPRTMLRYAIEKFPENLRQDYLKGRI